jgi:hypothetical protein
LQPVLRHPRPPLASRFPLQTKSWGVRGRPETRIFFLVSCIPNSHNALCPSGRNRTATIGRDFGRKCCLSRRLPRGSTDTACGDVRFCSWRVRQIATPDPRAAGPEHSSGPIRATMHTLSPPIGRRSGPCVSRVSALSLIAFVPFCTSVNALPMSVVTESVKAGPITRAPSRPPSASRRPPCASSRCATRRGA